MTADWPPQPDTDKVCIACWPDSVAKSPAQIKFNHLIKAMAAAKDFHGNPVFIEPNYGVFFMKAFDMLDAEMEVIAKEYVDTNMKVLQDAELRRKQAEVIAREELRLLGLKESE